MKRTFAIALLLLLVISLIPAPTFALETTAREIIYLEDGSYITVELSEYSARSTKVRNSKTFTYHDSFGNEEWRAELIGIFNYDGTTVTVTSCICNVTITDTAWSYTQKRCYVNGGSALCDLTMVKTINGVTSTIFDETLSLTCSPTGEFS